jgi:hypothetical protein
VATGQPNGQDCEIAVGLTGDIEAYMYRDAAVNDGNRQACWDALESGELNTGRLIYEERRQH